MDKIILRVSCVSYAVAVGGVFWTAFYNQPTMLPIEIQSYMQWWYSQPNTEIQAFMANLGMFAMLLTSIGALGLLFLKKWGGYIFLVSVLILMGTEWLLPGFPPRSSLEISLNTIASVSAGCILAIVLLSKQLKTFEHNKSLNLTGAKNAPPG